MLHCTLPARAVLDLDVWQREVIVHPDEAAAHAAAAQDAAMLTGQDVYVHAVDTPEGCLVLFDPPARARVSKVEAHDTDDSRYVYADTYVDLTFHDPEHAARAQGGWSHGRQHAYPRQGGKE
jgi:hypothetical protein